MKIKESNKKIGINTAHIWIAKNDDSYMKLVPKLHPIINGKLSERKTCRPALHCSPCDKLNIDTTVISCLSWDLPTLLKVTVADLITMISLCMIGQ